MNLNLTDHVIQLWGHRQVLVNAGYRVAGPPVLLPDAELPGVFEVWWPVVDDAGTQFLWVSPDGETVRQDLVVPEQFVKDEDSDA